VLNLKDQVIDYTLHSKEYMKNSLVNLINNVLYTDMSDKGWTEGLIASGTNKSIRSVKVRDFQEESIENSVSKRIIYNDLKRFVSSVETLYKEKVSSWYFSRKTYFQFLHYDKDNGGHYNYHVDHYADAPRSLTILVGLNSSNEYEGGELFVHNQEEGLKLGAGDFICFPSNFMYPHKVSPLKKGERKVLVIWTL